MRTIFKILELAKLKPGFLTAEFVENRGKLVLTTVLSYTEDLDNMFSS
jgi:hypothetical protein